MFSRIFSRKAKLPALTEFCINLSDPERLIKFVHDMTAADDRTAQDNRAIVLMAVELAAAGHFVRNLRWDKQPMWEGSDSYLRNTNLDVITAEALVWIHYLIHELKRNDRKDRGMTRHIDDEDIDDMTNGRIHGRIVTQTFPFAADLTLGFIKSETGVDFTERSMERRKLYFKARDEKRPSCEVFASVVLQCVGCQSLSDPPKSIALPSLVEMPIFLNVSTFFSTKPIAFYETFKIILQAEPMLFFGGSGDWE
jgi:hypothetical protein